MTGSSFLVQVVMAQALGLEYRLRQGAFQTHFITLEMAPELHPVVGLIELAISS